MDPTAAPEKRRSDRFFPTNPVNVDLESETSPLAQGVVADISGGGACVCRLYFHTRPGRSVAAFSVGEEVLVRISFPRQPQSTAATARVVWKGGGGSEGNRYGLQWTHAGPQRSQLESLIAKHCVDAHGFAPRPSGPSSDSGGR